MIHNWTREQDQFLLKNRHLGYPKVAAELGLSEDQVRRRYNKLTNTALKTVYNNESVINIVGNTIRLMSGKPNIKRNEVKLGKNKKPCMLEICAADLHLGKLAYGKETGQDDYDVNIASSIFVEKVLEILSDTENFNIELFTFVVGNDFFHTEASGTTTKGTPQHSDSRWQKVFSIGMRLITDMVDLLATIAPVHVVCVPGNHDNASNFYLGCALEAYYKNVESITIDNAPTQRKYIRYGTSLIGFTHGDKEKHDNLPIILASERPKDWAETTCREFHIGHFHQSASIKYGGTETNTGVIVRKTSSLSATDAWHAEQGYCMPIRALDAFLYDRDNGFKAHFRSNFISNKK